MTTFSTDITAAQYREMSHGAMTPEAKVDQWVDWGGHTVTVDPIGNKKWILESDTYGHSESLARKRRFDSRDVQDLMNWFNSSEPGHQEYFSAVPPMGSYDAPGCVVLDKWRGQSRDTSRYTKLPVITAMIYGNELPDKERGDIEAEMRERERTAGARLFSC